MPLIPVVAVRGRGWSGSAEAMPVEIVAQAGRLPAILPVRLRPAGSVPPVQLLPEARPATTSPLRSCTQGVPVSWAAKRWRPHRARTGRPLEAGCSDTRGLQPVKMAPAVIASPAPDRGFATRR